MEHLQKHPPCENHPHGRPVSTCPGCGKTVCSECIRQFGYFCSEACRDAARAAAPKSEEEAVNYVEAQQRYDAIARILFRRLPLSLGALIALVVLIRWIDPTGDEQWKIELPGSRGVTSMLEAEESLIVLDGNGRVAALGIHSGEEQWSVPEEEAVYTMDRVGESLILAGRNQIRCVSAADGSPQWALDLQEDAYRVHWQSTPNAVVAATASYASSSPDDEAATWVANSAVMLADTVSGEIRWHQTLNSQTVHQVGFFADQPWCLTSESDRYLLEALNPENGRRAWGMRTTGDDAPTIFVTDARMVILRPDEILAVGPDGTMVWTEPLSGQVTLATQVVDQLIICLDRKRLRCVDTLSGEPQWTTEVPGWVEEMSVGDHMLFVRVAGWMKQGEEPPGGPLESMPDGPEKQLLEELFFDNQEGEDGDEARVFADVDRLATYDLRKGRLRWDQRMERSTVTAGARCCYQLQTVSGMGSLMGGDTSGRLTVRTAIDGDVLWRYKSDAELTSLREGHRHVYVVTTTILPEMLSKYGGGRPPQIGLVAIRKHGFLHRLTHW